MGQGRTFARRNAPPPFRRWTCPPQVGRWVARRLPALGELHFQCRHSRTFNNPNFEEDVAMGGCCSPPHLGFLLGAGLSFHPLAGIHTCGLHVGTHSARARICTPIHLTLTHLPFHPAPTTA